LASRDVAWRRRASLGVDNGALRSNAIIFQKNKKTLCLRRRLHYFLIDRGEWTMCSVPPYLANRERLSPPSILVKV
jgi:hypothetical protein